jgi:hypothetical protein
MLEIDVHPNIAPACISSLRSGLVFVSPSLPEEGRQIRVLESSHGMQLCANEFWVDHLIRYVDLCNHLALHVTNFR